MKRLAFFLAFLLLSAPALAESYGVGGQWRGLNNGDASILIDDNEAQDLLNVDITENAFGIKKRAGYATFKSLTVSTAGVRGAYSFRDANGVDNIIHAQDIYVLKSQNGNDYTSIITTATAGAYWDFTDSNGFLYGANSQRDEIWRYNGSALTYYPSHPKGTQIEWTPDRLAIAGTTANPNRVHFSKLADPTTFTTGINEEDPFTEDFGLPGQSIVAIRWFQDKLLVWTKTSLSYWYGTNQFDGIIEEISSNVGTLQPYSIISFGGMIYWQGQNGHFYVYDGSIVTKLSENITGSVDGFIKASDPKFWLQTAQSDFNLGTYGLGLSSTASVGDVKFGGSTLDNFSDGNYTSGPTWTTYDLAASANWAVASEELVISTTSGSPTPKGGIYTASSISTGSWSFDIYDMSGSATVFCKLCVSVPTCSDCSGSPREAGCYSFAFTAPDNIQMGVNTTSLSTDFSNTTFMDGTRHEVSINRNSSGVFNIFIDGNHDFTYTDTTLSSIAYVSVGMLTGTNTKIKFDNFAYDKYQKSTFTSVAFNIGTGITAWGRFELNNVLNSGAIQYAVYGDTDSTIDITDSGTFTSSQTITNNSVPSISTASYLTWTAYFTRTANSQEPTLNDVTVRWSEGSDIYTWGAYDTDDRLLWSVGEGTATATNASYLLDLRNLSWLKYSVPFDAAILANETLYFGGPSTGVVYSYPSGNTDDGSAITAYWKSKDFISGNPYVEKEYKTLSLVAKAQSGSNLDITYTYNTTAATSYNISLTDANGYSYIRNNYYLPSGTFGTFWNVKFGNDDANAPFECYSFSYDYKPRPWRVMP